ncbi:MAG: ABC transporter transmembrane domain-containing protein, partial [Halothece sp. Uz-M2-17]|nr:ABC transporter transmembrane domain-containing protein [Halothece sp. Uz-M2-17]
MLNVLKNLSYLLSRRDKMQVVALFCLLLIGSCLEMLGVGFVVPFISFISKPDLIQEQPILNGIYNLLGSPSQSQFLVILCLIYLVIYVIKNSYLTGMYYIQYRFVFNKQIKVSDQLFQSYLGAPYHFHLQKNSAILIRNLTQEINQLFMQVLIPLVMFITELTVVTGLVVLLITLQPLPSLVATSGLAIAGIILYRVFREKLSEAGKKRQYHSGQVIQHINQGLGGVKETKVLGRELFFLHQHRNHRKEFVRSLELVQMIQQLPRLYFETLAVFALLSIILVTLLQGTGITEVLPTISLFAATAFRVIPSLNKMMNSLNKVRFSSNALDVVVHELKTLETEKNLLGQKEGVIPLLTHQLKLNNV